MWNQIQREPFVRVEWTFLIHNHFFHFSFFISPVERSDYKRRMQKGGTRGCTRIAFPMQFFPLPCFPIFINHYISSHSSLYLCSSPYSVIFVYIFSTSIFSFLFEDSICSSGFQSPACLFRCRLLSYRCASICMLLSYVHIWKTFSTGKRTTS